MYLITAVWTPPACAQLKMFSILTKLYGTIAICTAWLEYKHLCFYSVFTYQSFTVPVMLRLVSSVHNWSSWQDNEILLVDTNSVLWLDIGNLCSCVVRPGQHDACGQFLIGWADTRGENLIGRHWYVSQCDWWFMPIVFYWPDLTRGVFSLDINCDQS